MIIIGAGGLAKQVVDIVVNEKGANELYFYDDTAGASDYFLDKFPIIHHFSELTSRIHNRQLEFSLAISAPKYRKLFYHRLVTAGAIPTSLIASDILISQFQTSIGAAATILPGVLIEASVTVGTGVLLNVSAKLTHDSMVGNFCEIGPGSILCGGAVLEDEVTLGAGCIILPRIHVGKGATVGAGAVVTKHVANGDIVKGVPAKSCL